MAITPSRNPNSGALQGQQSLAIDGKGLNSLKRAAKDDSPEAIRAVAKQFEAIFVNMMLKSMRDATPHDGPFDSEQSRTFVGMLDQQLSQDLAGRGIGLSEALVRQLSKNAGASAAQGENPEALAWAAKLANASNSSDEGRTDTWEQEGASVSADALVRTGYSSSPFLSRARRQAIAVYREQQGDSAGSEPSSKSTQALIARFARQVGRQAERISRATGLPAKFMMAQAALESGFGRHEIKYENGDTSHNLFGVKAGSNWQGRVVEALTTEHIDGVDQKRVEKFRAYSSYEESFRDFATLIKNNPRYQAVMASLHDPIRYANAMQKSGYATDPQYAAKLKSMIIAFMGN
jgi:flagellar protein FlgJ